MLRKPGFFRGTALLFGVVALSAGGVGSAYGAGLPDVIERGLQAYHEEGAAGALRAWLHRSPLTRSGKQKGANLLVGQLHKVEAQCGDYLGYEVIRACPLGVGARLVYLAMQYSSCPLFARFLAYRGGGQWVLTQMQFNVNPDKMPYSPGLCGEGDGPVRGGQPVSAAAAAPRQSDRLLNGGEGDEEAAWSGSLALRQAAAPRQSDRLLNGGEGDEEAAWRAPFAVPRGAVESPRGGGAPAIAAELRSASLE